MCSITTDSVSAYLLRLFGIRQRFHRYVPQFGCLPENSYLLAGALSRDLHLTFPQFYERYPHLFPQNNGFVSAITSALLKKQSPRESLLAEPRTPSLAGPNGLSSHLKWASTPFSKPSKIKYLSYKSSVTEYVPANLQPTKIPSSIDWLKITYGQLPRRSSPWGPTIPV